MPVSCDKAHGFLRTLSIGRYFESCVTVAESYDDLIYFYHFQKGRMLKGLEASPRPLKSPWQLVKYCIIRGTRSSGLRASAWKALADERTTFTLTFRNFVIEFWESEVLPCSREVGLLSILLKKGNYIIKLLYHYI